MTDIWFTADLHFDHAKILTHHARPGHEDGGVEQMNETIVENWNAVVDRRDDVWVLGDFFLGRAENAGKWFRALRGHKHLVVGNHDSKAVQRLPWTSVDQLRQWKQKPHRATLCHYPLLTWPAAHHGAWMLHGHSHGSLNTTTTTRMDVGIDCHPEFRPFNLAEIEAEMATRAYRAVDHHREDRT